MFNGGRYSSTHLNDRITTANEDKVSIEGSPDFVKLADAYGAEGFRVFNETDLDDALKKAAGLTDVPMIIDCVIEPEANVWPMVSPGAGLAEMVFCVDKEEE
jgi:acetolactate synthase-1/2/3 large subunit